MTRHDLELYGDSDHPHGRPRRVVGRLMPRELSALESAEPAVRPVPAAGQGRWVWLSGHATPRLRQHAADVAVVVYVVACFAICAAVALVASVIGLAAWHVIAWMEGL